MRLIKILAPSLAVVALTACAAPGDNSPMASMSGSEQCFYSSDVRSFTDAGKNVVLVAIGARDAWELTLQSGCPNVGTANSVGIVSRGRTRICQGADAEIIVPNVSGSGAQRCLVRTVRKLTPEEAATARGT